ncbi:MAG: MBL fold metallo-hydrolase [Calditrichaceae bacterium]
MRSIDLKGIQNPLKNLHQIDLDQSLRGYHKFINCWLYRENDITIVVDPGPRSSFPVLKKALESLDVKRIDYILLTHIHIDHAGCTGLLLNEYPTAKVICHPRGIPHMINPSDLWEGSLKILGKLAEVYGEIAPVNTDKISFLPQINDRGVSVDVYETPGHASHHMCYRIGDILFAGEAAGVNVPAGDPEYLRIATPPVFKYDIYQTSLDKAASIPAKYVCFGHYGISDNPESVFERARFQMFLWIKIVERHFQRKSKNFYETVFNELLISDPSIAAYPSLPEDIREREKYFAFNSIKGMYEYFKKQHSSV